MPARPTTSCRFTVCVYRGRLSVCECASFPFGFLVGMKDYIILVPDNCISFYFAMLPVLLLIKKLNIKKIEICENL